MDRCGCCVHLEGALRSNALGQCEATRSRMECHVPSTRGLKSLFSFCETQKSLCSQKEAMPLLLGNTGAGRCVGRVFCHLSPTSDTGSGALLPEKFLLFHPANNPGMQTGAGCTPGIPTGPGACASKPIGVETGQVAGQGWD